MSFNKLIFSLLFLCLFNCSCAVKKNQIQPISQRIEGVIQKDTIWSGNITIVGDVVVKKGVKLTILSGTIIHVDKSQSTKVEPLYFSGNLELIILGSLQIKGKKNKRVIFSASSENNESGIWAGIIFKNTSGKNYIKYCDIFNAETAVNIINSSVDISDCKFQENIYGVVISSSDKKVKIQDSEFSHNKYGIYSLFLSHPLIKNNSIRLNKEEGVYYTLDSIPILEKNVIKNNAYNIRFLNW